MKKLFYYFIAVVILFNVTGCAATRTISSFIRAKSYIDSGLYDKAIVACQESLESNQGESPLTMTMDGTKGINADFFSRICLGASYGMLGDLEKSKDNLLKANQVYPDKAFINYLFLSDVYYKYNRIDEAYKYALKAKETVGTNRYYEMMKNSALDSDTWVNAVDAAIAFYELKLNYKELEQQLALGNNNKALQIANSIANKKYKVHLGANGHDTYLDLLNKGGMADLNGLMVGDKVLMINNTTVHSEKEMVRQLSKVIKQYGETVIYKIERQGRIIDIEAKLVYPEVESAKRILADLMTNVTNSYRHIARVDSNGPWIKILEPKTSRGVRIALNQRASFAILASGINKIKSVTVNDLECTVSDTDSLEKTLLLKPHNIKKFTIKLPLAQGNNKFAIKAIDTQGNKTQQDIEIDGDQTFSKETGKAYDRKVAVVIGINKYMDPEYDSLEFAVKDAQDVKEQINKMGFDQIIYIPEDNATKTGILQVLGDDLPYIMGKNDALFVYFAGHGGTEELENGKMEGYILPRDVKKKNYRGTAISMEKIREVIQRYKAKHILFVLDSCYSGYATIPKTLNQSSYPHEAVQIITAGTKEEEASEDPKVGHGIFTKAFLDSFNDKGLYSGEGIILATDIWHFVKKQVSRQTGGKQNPQYMPIEIEGAGDFKFENYN